MGSTPRRNEQEVPPEQRDSLAAVLELVRFGRARTRPELVRESGLGRTVVTQRLRQLLTAGLVEEGALGVSTGGRSPRELRFCADAGSVLVAELGATTLSVGITDLAGGLLGQWDEAWDIAAGPERTLARIEQLFDALVADVHPPAPWGVGIGLPGPVEFASGRPVAPPIMPGWDGYPVRDHFATRYDVPAWVDNDVNVMALGEYRVGRGRGHDHLIHVKIGTGIGAGLVVGGRLHRGAQGCAGDIGHVAVVSDVLGTASDAGRQVCRCGNLGCLEALAGGVAIARDATTAARAGRSEVMAARLDQAGVLTSVDVLDAAGGGDAVAVELLQRAGRLIGETLAALVNFANPSLLLLGGSVGGSGDLLLACIRESVYRRSLPLATRDLLIARSELGQRAGLIGAAMMVVDELLGQELLGRSGLGSRPTGLPALVSG